MTALVLGAFLSWVDELLHVLLRPLVKWIYDDVYAIHEF